MERGRGHLLKSVACVSFVFVGALALMGCAAVKGALAGITGGAPYVDEIVHDEIDPTSFHTNLKLFGHQAVILVGSLAFWPLAAAYGGASCIYGTYRFISADDTPKPLKGNRMPTRTTSDTPAAPPAFQYPTEYDQQ